MLEFFCTSMKNDRNGMTVLIDFKNTDRKVSKDDILKIFEGASVLCSDVTILYIKGGTFENKVFSGYPKCDKPSLFYNPKKQEPIDKTQYFTSLVEVHLKNVRELSDGMFSRTPLMDLYADKNLSIVGNYCFEDCPLLSEDSIHIMKGSNFHATQEDEKAKSQLFIPFTAFSGNDELEKKYFEKEFADKDLF